MKERRIRSAVMSQRWLRCVRQSWAGFAWMPIMFVVVCTSCRARPMRDGDLGDPCENTLDCVVDAICQEETQTCQLELEETPDGIAADCETNNDCGDGLLCQQATQTCQVLPDDDPGVPGPVLLGGLCAADDECDVGLVCQFASETCQPTSGEGIEGIGATCITNGDCSQGLMCQDESQTCQPPPAEEGDAG